MALTPCLGSARVVWQVLHSKNSTVRLDIRNTELRKIHKLHCGTFQFSIPIDPDRELAWVLEISFLMDFPYFRKQSTVKKSIIHVGREVMTEISLLNIYGLPHVSKDPLKQRLTTF